MPTDPWLPRGFSPLPGVTLQRCASADAEGDEDWQIYETPANGRVLVATAALRERWLTDKLLLPEQIPPFQFGKRALALLEGGRGQRLECVDENSSPHGWNECKAFTVAMAATRALGTAAGFHDAVYVERLSRLLPCYSPAPATQDAVVAGFWMTGGVNVSLTSHRRMQQLLPWLSKEQLESLIADVAPLQPATDGHASEPAATATSTVDGERREGLPAEPFRLPGRPFLENFFNEHVIDLVRHEERYRALGVHFPGAILLHGPPGCGKTFAVEKLIEYLDWPSQSIDSGSIGSPYIHETGRKIAEAFEAAAKQAPAVLVMDEIDAFLATREQGVSGQHRVEEVAEFLRRIPEAASNKVLLIGMTNRLDSLDPAVVRRGRFDHIIEIGMPSQLEVSMLLTAKLAEIPTSGDIDRDALAKALTGRPLSDLAFIVREACRLAARAGMTQVGAAQFADALAAAPARIQEAPKARKIGFV